MPQCARDECQRWKPELLVRFAHVGVRVDGEWFCSSACVAESTALRLQHVPVRQEVQPRLPPLRLGTLLVHAGAVTPEQLREALRSQETSGLRLGAELRRLRYASAEDVLRALAAQAGVSFVTGVDVTSVRSAPGGLCAQEVSALGLVPFRVKEEERVVMVACAAPVPRAALGALHQLTGYRPVPLLVTDEEFDLLSVAYGADQPLERPPVRASWADGVHDAARRIAATAVQEGTVTMAEARVQPLTWVRVTGKHGVDALLVTQSHDAATVEGNGHAWLADTTQH